MVDDKTKEVVENVTQKYTYDTYAREITEYLTSKLADYNVPIHTIMEIAQYCFTATYHIANTEVRRACKQYENAMRRGR